MVVASLPISLTSDLETVLRIGYSRTDGVTFGFTPEATRDEYTIKSILTGALYWVKPGTSLPFLPGFTPSTDSIVLKTLSPYPQMTGKMCHPFPAFISYENIDSGEMLSSLIDQLRNDIRAMFSPPEEEVNQIAEGLMQKFENQETSFFCNPGVTLGIPAELTTLPDIDRGFKIRTWSSEGNELIYPHVYIHHLKFLDYSIPINNVIYDQLQYGISASVGDRTPPCSNTPDDIILVKQRLHDLGFTHGCTSNPSNPQPMGMGPICGSTFIDIIRLFQATHNGHRNYVIGPSSFAAGVTGYIIPGDVTEDWLWASNCPTWSQMETIPNLGVFNEIHISGVRDKDFEWGTGFLKTCLRKAARHLFTQWFVPLSFAEKNRRSFAWGIRTTHASRQGGGESFHYGHESGIDVDVRLPRMDGTAGGAWCIPSDSAANSNNPPNPNYDRAAARAICEGFSVQGIVDEIFFNDPTINQRASTPVAKVTSKNQHHHHIHISMNPPAHPTPVVR